MAVCNKLVAHFSLLMDVLLTVTSVNRNDLRHHCCVILWLQLQFDPFRSVGILGFNSPEWLISNMAAIFAGFVCSFLIFLLVMLLICHIIRLKHMRAEINNFY